jgi:hypothetical protein
MHLKSAIIFVVLNLILALHPARSNAQELLFESARLGPTNKFGTGLLVGQSQYFGVRFHLEHPAVLTGVGGHMVGYGFMTGNPFHAVIVRLPNHSALPAGNPFTAEEVVAVAPCVLVSNFSMDYIFPLTVELPAGHYALVYAGAAVNAAMIEEAESINHSSYMIWDQEGWRDYANLGNGKRALPEYRFTIYGSYE